jgi:ABC-2 type transport system ATP-binding protein
LEAPAFYPNLNAVDNLKITCLIKGISFNEIPTVLKDVGLFEKRRLDFQKYSLGMKQRLGIASALLGNPKLLILDEPTNGLDPEGIALVRSLIVKKSSEGAAVIIASHILDEVEKSCSKLLVLNQGQKAFQGETKELLDPENKIAIHYHDLKKLKEALKELTFITRLEDFENYLLITLPLGFDGSDISRLLMKQNIILSEVYPIKKSLEKALLKLLAD